MQRGAVWREYRGPADVFLEIGKSKRYGGLARRQNDEIGHVATIWISAEQYGPRLLLHELAHLIAGPRAGHRPRFVTAYLALLHEQLGDEARDRLLFGLVRCGVPGQWEIPAGGPSWVCDESVPHVLAEAGIRLWLQVDSAV